MNILDRVGNVVATVTKGNYILFKDHNELAICEVDDWFCSIVWRESEGVLKESIISNVNQLSRCKIVQTFDKFPEEFLI